MKKIQDILTQLLSRYSRYLTMFVTNMRLIILIVFGILCGYLVVQVNNLISDGSVTANSDSTVTARKPDSDVISVFNELQSQNVQVSSQFDYRRNSPF